MSLFREPKDDEEMADYVFPRATVLFSGFLLFIAICCVLGSYLA